MTNSGLAPAPPTRVNSRVAAMLTLAAAPDLGETSLPQPTSSSTPARLWRLQAFVVAALLFLGSVITIQLFDLRAQLSSAAELASQYTRLTAVEADLVEAGNLAALRAGGNSAAQVAPRLNAASSELIALAAQRPSAQVELAAIATATNSYAALLLQDVPSSSDIANADTIRTTQLIPALNALRDAVRSEAATQAWTYSPWITWSAVVITVAALIAASVSLAKLTHRFLNLGVAAAALAVALIAVIAAAGVGQATTADQNARDTKLSAAVSLGKGRLDLGELRRYQTRAILSGGANKASLDAQDTLLNELLTNPALSPTKTRTLVAAYKVVRTTIADGTLVTAATKLTTAPATSAASAFLDQITQDEQAAYSSALDQARSASSALVIAAICVMVITAIGATVAVLGISGRRKEYA